MTKSETVVVKKPADSKVAKAVKEVKAVKTDKRAEKKVVKTLSGKTVSITLIKSLHSTKPGHRLTVKSLGLKRIGHTVERPDNVAVRGMITQVGYLLSVK